MIPKKINPVLNSLAQICENLKSELSEIQDEKEIYFHDIISSVIDQNTPTDKNECMKLIEKADTQYFDDGLIDKSSWERQLITMAYCSIEQEIFNNSFINELQEELNNETISSMKAGKLIEKISKFQKEYFLTKVEFKDTDTQIYIQAINFELKKEDLGEPYFDKKAVIDLTDGFKILTSENRDKINKNAIVIERITKGKGKFVRYRVYLMDKDKDLDIKKLWRVKGQDTIGEHNGYNLDPRTYIDGFKSEFESKKQLLYVINDVAHQLLNLNRKNKK